MASLAEPNGSSGVSPIRRGVTQAQDPEQAAAELYESIQQPNISLAVFFCSPDYDLEALAQGLRSSFGNVPLIGCTTAGEITPCGYQNGTLTGFSLAAPDFVVATMVLDDLANFSMAEGRSAGLALVKELRRLGREPDGDNTFSLFLTESMSRKEEIVVNTLHGSLGDISLFGGSAGARQAAYVYHHGEFHIDCAVMALVQTTRPFLVFKTENYIPTGIKMVITEADPALRKAKEINGAPALPEYLRLVGAEADEDILKVFAAHSAGVMNGGRLYIRSMGAENGKPNDDQSIDFSCAIDEGVILTLAEHIDFIQNLQELFDKIHAEIGQPELVVACDCYYRLLEIERSGVKSQAGALMMANHAVGFSSFGEQFNSMHINQSLTGVAIG